MHVESGESGEPCWLQIEKANSTLVIVEKFYTSNGFIAFLCLFLLAPLEINLQACISFVLI